MNSLVEQLNTEPNPDYCRKIPRSLCNKFDNCYECEYQYYKDTMKDRIKLWLDSFNTDSATVCFTAIQELKKEVTGG